MMICRSQTHKALTRHAVYLPPAQGQSGGREQAERHHRGRRDHAGQAAPRQAAAAAARARAGSRQRRVRCLPCSVSVRGGREGMP